MGIYTRPNIVTNGLILSLDALNIKSYTSGSTVWRNLVNSTSSGSFVNGTTYSRDGGGTVSFNGTTQYVDCGDIASTIRGTQNFTIEVVGKKPSAGSDFHVGAWTATNRQGIFLQWFTDSVVYFGVNNNTTNSNRATVTYTSNFYHFVGAFDGSQASDANKGKIFVNGVQQAVTTYLTSPTTVPTTQVNFYIGYLPGYGYGANSMSIVRLYNRTLSAQEIQQNYNVVKSRFNLT
jgi:hypothetical protein